jgi:hypothetical protein
MVATPSSKIGSIGVYIMHVDLSGALDQAGIQISYVEAPKGGMKTAGSSYRRLDKKAEQYLQAFVDASYDEFVALIVENRGLDDAAIRETEARVFRADEALALGLIDEVKTPSEAVSTFVAELADDEPSEEEDEEMTTKTPATAAAPAAAAPEVASAPTADQIQAAVTADRERMRRDQGAARGVRKPKLAETLAIAGYTVEQANPGRRRLKSRRLPADPTISDRRDQGAPRGVQAAEARRDAGRWRLYRRARSQSSRRTRRERRAEGGRDRTISKPQWPARSSRKSALALAAKAARAARSPTPSFRSRSSRITRRQPAAATSRRSNFAIGIGAGSPAGAGS